MSDVTTSPSILWFRQDLRLADNAALHAALGRGGPVIPVFIWDEVGEGAWGLGAASRWWLHHSLVALAESLAASGLRLILRRGEAEEVLRELLQETGAQAVYWGRRYEPAIIARDKAVKSTLTTAGIEAKSFNNSLLFEPHAVTNKQGGPFQVFTPYWRHCLSLPVPEVVRLPKAPWPAPARWPHSLAVGDLRLLPTIPRDAGFAKVWTPGESGAAKRLRAFWRSVVERYGDERDFPSAEAISRLSPHLHFGEISPRQIWAEARAQSRDSGVFPANRGVQKFLSEVGWREFAHQLLYHFPHTPERPLRAEFAAFPWADDPGDKLLKAWQRGRTGYPIIDAGMRELWHTGFMHNRVRMVAASFLVKHLRLHWSKGAAWFWDTLVDADLANNTLGWQWTAGCGADAAPYFRVFAPVLQGAKFDGRGDYVRRWVPELARLPDEYLHSPWTAPAEVLAACGVVLGKSYPSPIVDHKLARDQALAAYQTIRKNAGE